MDPFEFDTNYQMFDYDSDCSTGWIGDWHRADFEPDPLYYFTKWKFDCILRQTDRAYQFKHGDSGVWVPKLLCRKLRYTKKHKIKVYIWNRCNMNFRPIDS